MHRCNDASLDTVLKTPTATNWTQRDRLNRRLIFITRRFFRWSQFFCSGLPTAMWPSPLYIRAPPGSFKLPLTHWITEATLEKWRECFEQWDEDLVHWLCSNLEESNRCMCSRCTVHAGSWAAQHRGRSVASSQRAGAGQHPRVKVAAPHSNSKTAQWALRFYSAHLFKQS